MRLAEPGRSATLPSEADAQGPKGAPRAARPARSGACPRHWRRDADRAEDCLRLPCLSQHGGPAVLAYGAVASVWQTTARQATARQASARQVSRVEGSALATLLLLVTLLAVVLSACSANTETNNWFSSLSLLSLCSLSCGCSRSRTRARSRSRPVARAVRQCHALRVISLRFSATISLRLSGLASLAELLETMASTFCADEVLSALCTADPKRSAPCAT